MLNELLIWQLIDTAFPSGGFAHSGGLEAARQGGEVPDAAALMEFLRTSIIQAGYAAVPFVTAVHQDIDRIQEVDEFCDAFMTNHIANQASRAQGQALLYAAASSFDHSGLAGLRQQCRVTKMPQHYCVAFGAVFHHLDIPLAETIRAFLFVSVRDLIGAAVRLNIVGPMQAQAVQVLLQRLIQATAESATLRSLEEVTQISPVIDVFQAAHECLYSRLFRS